MRYRESETVQQADNQATGLVSVPRETSAHQGGIERVSRNNWTDFDGVDAPDWMSEERGALFCSLLNSYIPQEYGERGVRYHLLNHFNGGLYFHLLGR